MKNAYPLIALALLVSTRSDAGEVKLKLMSAGAMTNAGYYMPQRLALSESKPAGLKKTPADLAAPLYGEIKLGPSESPSTFYVIVDEPEGKAARLLVDANGNGDLTDAPAAEWNARTNKAPDGKESIIYSGGASLKVPYGPETLELHLAMYRFDKNDPGRAALKNTLFYYRDYARSGEITLGNGSYKAMLLDERAGGDFRAGKSGNQPGAALLIDVNGDGKFSGRGESFDVTQPFNIGGTTYEISGMTADGSSFQIVKSSRTVEETKPRPILEAGHAALAFEAKTTDGKPARFPETYKGKVVLLDFWATWCGPCVAELPNITAAYEKFHPQGFEILGVSLDQADAAGKLASFTDEHKMPWPQIYDGKFWKAAVAQQYGIDSIPHAFLVDGDTGLIAAEGENIRGDKLAPAIEKALTKKNGGSSAKSP
jgi:peroxiredoxin